MFVLSYFHGIISERRSYIPQGWSKFYEFSFADFIAALKISETIDSVSATSLKTYKGLLESAIYGGRIDNSSDMKVLGAYLESYFEAAKLSGSKDVSDGITMPSDALVGSHLNAFSNLSAVDNPGMFGLSRSADIAVQKYNVQEIISMLKKIKQADASNVKFDREQWKTDLGPIIKQWKGYYGKLLEVKIPMVKEEELLTDDPLNGFVLSEIRNSLNTIKTLSETFKKMIGILKGELALEETIQKVCISLILMKTPVDWLNLWEGPDTPNEWLRVFFKKLIALKNWADIVKAGKGFGGQKLNLNDLFNPQTFLNAQKQATSRKLKTPIDELTLVVGFSEGEVQSNNCLCLSDMLLQGCDFENNKLKDVESEDANEFINLPSIYVAYKPKSEGHSAEGKIDVPVYQTFERERVISEFRLSYTDKNKLIIMCTAIALT